MKQVIEVYGKFLLEAVGVAALALLLLVGIRDTEGNRGIFQMVGAKLPVESIVVEDYFDAEIYKSESEKQPPTIRLQLETMIKTGTQKISDYLIAEDYDANLLPIKILSVINPEGTDITGDCNPDTAEILFAKPGIYTVTVAAKDDGNRKTIKVVKIPVNDEREEKF